MKAKLPTYFVKSKHPNFPNIVLYDRNIALIPITKTNKDLFSSNEVGGRYKEKVSSGVCYLGISAITYQTNNYFRTYKCIHEASYVVNPF